LRERSLMAAPGLEQIPHRLQILQQVVWIVNQLACVNRCEIK